MSHFILRVYGIVLRDGHVLLSREQYRGIDMIKFPGGGMEFGEVPTETLKREFKEETGLDIRPGSLFYLTDFFQESAFHPGAQLLSFYFLADFVNWEGINPIPVCESVETFWQHISLFEPEMLTFPIDRHVGEMLKKNT